MEYIITVLEAFSDVRTGQTFAPGEVITDPAWHAPGDRRAEAMAARGKVKVEPVKEKPAAVPVEIKVELAEAPAAPAERKKQEGK